MVVMGVLILAYNVCHYFLDVNGKLYITGTTCFTDAISPGKDHEK